MKRREKLGFDLDCPKLAKHRTKIDGSGHSIPWVRKKTKEKKINKRLTYCSLFILTNVLIRCTFFLYCIKKCVPRIEISEQQQQKLLFQIALYFRSTKKKNSLTSALNSFHNFSIFIRPWLCTQATRGNKREREKKNEETSTETLITTSY